MKIDCVVCKPPQQAVRIEKGIILKICGCVFRLIERIPVKSTKDPQDSRENYVSRNTLSLDYKKTKSVKFKKAPEF